MHFFDIKATQNCVPSLPLQPYLCTCANPSDQIVTVKVMEHYLHVLKMLDFTKSFAKLLS